MDALTLLDDIGLRPGETVYITGTGGKTTLLWRLATLARRLDKVIVGVTAKMLPPEEPHYEKLFLDPSLYDKADHAPGGIQLVAHGKNEKGKLLGLTEEQVLKLIAPDTYLLLEADGSRGKKLKMWYDHEPAVYPTGGLTLGILPISALHETVTEDSVYNPEGFQGVTNCKVGEQVTKQALLEMALNKGGMFRHSRGRKVLIINQCDSDRLFQNALDFSRHLAEDPRSQGISAIICLSLKELANEDYRHYFSRRLIPTDGTK